MTVKESTLAQVEKKLSRFDPYFGEDTEAKVTFRMNGDKAVIEITILYAGTVFRSEEEAEDLRDALDLAVETLEGQIRKNKTKLEKKIREGAFLRTVPNEPQEEEPEIVRVKRFPEKPMTPEEAILEMNLSRHQFYAFTDAESGKAAVVYARKNGGYGLLITE